MNREQLLKELQFKTSRSSGAGGQHVNKTESRVELLFNVEESEGLDETEKKRFKESLENQIDQEGVFHTTCETFRSQHRNKKEVIRKFFLILDHALEEKPERKPTKPSKKAIQIRLDNKAQQSEKKQKRSWRFDG